MKKILQLLYFIQSIGFNVILSLFTLRDGSFGQSQ